MRPEDLGLSQDEAWHVQVACWADGEGNIQPSAGHAGAVGGDGGNQSHSGERREREVSLWEPRITEADFVEAQAVKVREEDHGHA